MADGWRRHKSTEQITLERLPRRRREIAILWCEYMAYSMILLEMGQQKFDRVHWLGPGRSVWKDYATNEISSCSGFHTPKKYFEKRDRKTKINPIRNSQNKRSLLRRISNLEWCATISHANEANEVHVFFWCRITRQLWISNFMFSAPTSPHPEFYQTHVQLGSKKRKLQRPMAS